MASAEVKALKTIKERIYRHLFDIFRGDPIGVFKTWEPDSSEGSFETSTEVLPAGFTANEERISVGESQTMRSFRREVEESVWTVYVQFNCAVNTEFFDRALLDAESLIIPSGTATDGSRLPQIFVLVSQIAFTHPPTSGSSNGTTVRYTFRMLPSRS